MRGGAPGRPAAAQLRKFRKLPHPQPQNGCAALTLIQRQARILLRQMLKFPGESLQRCLEPQHGRRGQIAANEAQFVATAIEAAGKEFRHGSPQKIRLHRTISAPAKVPGGKSSDPGRRAKINDAQFVDFQEDIHQFARVKLESVDDLGEFPPAVLIVAGHPGIDPVDIAAHRQNPNLE